MDSHEVAIELQNVTKVFGDVIAVKDFSVKIRKGEFFSLLGPSGCGKTTTLRMIAGLENPTEGRILLEGKDVTGVPAYRRNVNTVFQDYALFPHMNVKKNIYFPLKMKKISMAEAEPKIKSVLSLVNMGGFEYRLPQQLSGGQRQRIALARSLVNEPAALLLDEPLGALDFKLRVAMQKVLKDIQRNVGITFVYVTHDQTEAMTMSDRIAVMNNGVVHQIGSPEEIYNYPSSPFVASFIGDMNFLRGVLISREKRMGVVDLSGEKVFSEKCAEELRPGDEVLFCVRAEKVLLNRKRSGSKNVLKARVQRVVFRGNDYEITCLLKGQEIRAIVAAANWNSSLKEGADIVVEFKPEDIILYPISGEKEVIKYSVEAV